MKKKVSTFFFWHVAALTATIRLDILWQFNRSLSYASISDRYLALDPYSSPAGRSSRNRGDNTRTFSSSRRLWPLFWSLCRYCRCWYASSLSTCTLLSFFPIFCPINALWRPHFSFFFPNSEHAYFYLLKICTNTIFSFLLSQIPLFSPSWTIFKSSLFLKIRKYRPFSIPPSPTKYPLLAPAHAIYFAVWEACKRQFVGAGHRGDELTSLQSGSAGICATVCTSSIAFDLRFGMLKTQYLTSVTRSPFHVI